eukprot:1145151-Pelagomonas_calceolata.AAC.4
MVAEAQPASWLQSGGRKAPVHARGKQAGQEQAGTLWQQPAHHGPSLKAAGWAGDKKVMKHR